MRNYVQFLTGNHIINVAILCWLTAQLIKLIIVLVQEKRLDFKRFLGAGGMPSSHSATVTGVAVAVGKTCGVYSVEFGIAITFAFVVIFDAFNVRREVGEQAKILNYIIKHWDETTPEIFGQELKELLGHTPLQVFVGILLGVIIGILL